MSRPCSIQRDAILEAARTVFLQYGYKAGTKQVAREAGVSEGSLFKHFKTKADLFLAAMESGDVVPPWETQFKQSAGTGNLRKNLEAFGRQVMKHMEIMLPRIMMVRSSGILLRRPPRGNPPGIPHPVRRLHAVADCFRAEIKAGRLAMRNPDVHAQIFVGALVHYVFHKLVFGLRVASPDIYVRTVVDMILKSSKPAARA